jgi:hypothetical protein
MSKDSAPLQSSPRRLADLPQATLEAIAARDYDRFVEKHEGPWSWASYLPADADETSADEPLAIFPFQPAEFLRVGGHDVLLPVGQDQHPYISILHTIISEDGRYLTLFLRDRTLAVRYPHYGEDPFDQFVAICLQLPGEDFFLALLYHQWLQVDLT